MGRRDFVFKWLLYALTALGFVLVQVFGLVHIRRWGVHPFLFPVLVSTVAALESAHESAVFALATGAVLDVTMPGVIPCFYTVAFLVVFLLARVLSAKVLSQPFFCCMLCGALSIVCADLLNMLFLKAYADYSLKTALLLLPFALAGLFLGLKCSSRMNESLVKKITSILLVLSGISLILKNL